MPISFCTSNPDVAPQHKPTNQTRKKTATENDPFGAEKSGRYASTNNNSNTTQSSTKPSTTNRRIAWADDNSRAQQPKEPSNRNITRRPENTSNATQNRKHSWSNMQPLELDPGRTDPPQHLQQQRNSLE